NPEKLYSRAANALFIRFKIPVAQLIQTSEFEEGFVWVVCVGAMQRSPFAFGAIDGGVGLLKVLGYLFRWNRTPRLF
ncbi:MAG: hypothetical protein AAGD32_02935, partial [Planctomycetota bacterium]